MKGFKILEFSDIEKGLAHYHKHGAEAGVYCGFKNIHEFYNMKLGGCTDWTGMAQSGKTQLCLEFLYNTSVFYGWVHMLMVPDIGDKIEVMAILIHIATGKTFDKRYRNFIELKKAFDQCDWILRHFKIIEKVDRSAKISPVDFWEFCETYKKTNQLNTGVIDSWKDMNHNYGDYGGNYAMYLSNVLPIRNEIAERNKLHFHTIIHPKTPRRGKDGKILHPQVDDMEGGAQWNNSGKTIISVHRDFDQTDVDIMFLKVKPRVVGKRGNTQLGFNWETARYFNQQVDGSGGIDYHYAKLKDELPSITNIDYSLTTKENEAPF